jgi:pimeloyl-ACP methyl ester carboxylesterase
MVWTGACGTFDDQSLSNAECNCRVLVPWDWRLEDDDGEHGIEFRTGFGSGTNAAIRWYPKDEVSGTRSVQAQFDIGVRRFSNVFQVEPYRHFVDGYLALDGDGETYDGDTSLVRVIDMPDGWLVVQVNGSTDENARKDFRVVTGSLRRLDSRPDGDWDRFEGVSPAQTTLETPGTERIDYEWGEGQAPVLRSGLCSGGGDPLEEAMCAARLTVFGPSGEGAVLLWVSGDGDALTSLAAQPFVDAGLTVVSVDLLGTAEQVAFTSVLGPRLSDVLYAVDHVSEELELGDRQIFLGGEGAGGGVALLAAIERPELAGLLLLAPLVDIGPDANLPEDTTLALMALDEGPDKYAVRSAIRYVSQLSVPTLVLTAEWSHGGLDGERLFATAHESRVPMTVHRVPNTDARALQPHAFSVFAEAILERPQAVSVGVDTGEVEHIGVAAGEHYKQRLKQELLAEVAPLLRVGEANEGSVGQRIRSTVAGRLSPRHRSDLRSVVLEESTAAKERSEVAWPEVTDFDRLQSTFIALEQRGLFGAATPQDCEYHGLARAMHLYEEATVETRQGVVYYSAPAVEHTLAGGLLRLNYRSPPGGLVDGRAIRTVLIEELSNAGLQGVPVPGMEAVDVTMTWQRRLSDDFWYD